MQDYAEDQAAFASRRQRAHTEIQSDPSIVIPDRFGDMVEDYASNFAARAFDPTHKAPPFLFIAGDKGVGKSTMAYEALARIGVDPWVFPVSSLAGRHEGDSTRPLESAYYEMGRGPRAPGEPPNAIIFDDFDRSIGVYGTDMTATTNTPALQACLMKIADDPHHITITGNDGTAKTFDVHPTMMIFTVNNAELLYPPLRRHVRSMIYNWVPGLEDKAVMLEGIFSGLSDKSRRKLVEAYPSQSIAFFQAVLNHMTKKAQSDFRAQRRGDKSYLFDPRFLQHLVELTSHLKHTAGLPQIKKAADELLEQSRIQNHLSEEV